MATYVALAEHFLLRPDLIHGLLVLSCARVEPLHLALQLCDLHLCFVELFLGSCEWISASESIASATGRLTTGILEAASFAERG